MRELTQVGVYLVGAAFVLGMPLLGFQLLLGGETMPVVATAEATTAGPTAPSEPVIDRDISATATRPVWIAPTVQYNYRPPVQATNPAASEHDKMVRREDTTEPVMNRTPGVDAAAAQAYGSADPPPAYVTPVLVREK